MCGVSNQTLSSLASTMHCNANNRRSMIITAEYATTQHGMQHWLVSYDGCGSYPKHCHAALLFHTAKQVHEVSCYVKFAVALCAELSSVHTKFDRVSSKCFSVRLARENTRAPTSLPPATEVCEAQRCTVLVSSNNNWLARCPVRLHITRSPCNPFHSSIIPL